MDINNLMFQAVSQLTVGLISDMTTLLLGMVTLFFLAIGFDKIRDVLRDDLFRRRENKLRSYMIEQRDIFQDERLAGSIDSDIARARYRSALSRLSGGDLDK